MYILLVSTHESETFGIRAISYNFLNWKIAVKKTIMRSSKFHKRFKKSVGVLYIDLYPYCQENEQIDFLIMQRNMKVELPGTWQAISGKIKDNETIKDAFWRHPIEKTGVEPSKIFKIDFINTFYDNYYDTVMMVPVAACELPHKDIKISELHIGYEWINNKKVKEKLIWPNQHKSIDMIVDMLKSSKKITEFHLLKK